MNVEDQPQNEAERMNVDVQPQAVQNEENVNDPPPNQMNAAIQNQADDNPATPSTSYAAASNFSHKDEEESDAENDNTGAFMCNICDQTFALKRSLKVHKQEQHLIVVCHFCEYYSTRRNIVYKHINNKHSDQPEIDISSLKKTKRFDSAGAARVTPARETPQRKCQGKRPKIILAPFGIASTKKRKKSNAADSSNVELDDSDVSVDATETLNKTDA